MVLKELIFSTGGSHLSQIFWEHENLFGLSVIWLMYIKLYRKRVTKVWQKIQTKWESGLTTVWLKWDPPVFSTLGGYGGLERTEL